MNVTHFKINKHIQDTLGVVPQEISPEKRLDVDLRADSLDVLDLEHTLEREFKTTISIKKTMTVQDVYDAVQAAVGTDELLMRFSAARLDFAATIIGYADKWLEETYGQRKAKAYVRNSSDGMYEIYAKFF